MVLPYIACTTPDPDIEDGYLLKRAWPVHHPKLKGVFVGGCVVRGLDTKFKAKAHAHYGEGAYSGWICFQSTRWLHVTEIWLHELAHIVANARHTPRWRETVLKLGGTLDRIPGVLRGYHPKKKKS